MATLDQLHKIVLNASNEQISLIVTAEVLHLLIQASNLLPQEENNSMLNCEDIFDAIFRSLSAKEVFAKFANEISFGLQSKSPAVVLKFINIIKSNLGSDPTLIGDIVQNSFQIFELVSKLMSDPDSDIAGEARRTLIVLAKNPRGFETIFTAKNGKIATILREFSGQNPIIRFRIHELITGLCGVSCQFLQECVRRGFLEELLVEMDSSDILLQLNALEILSNMAIGSQHCLRYLYDLGVLKKLHVLLMESQTAPDASFLFPAVIKFFGHLAKIDPKRCQLDFPDFLRSVFHLVLNYHLLEVGQRLLAFDTLSLIASTADGKSVLGNFDEEMRKCMKCFGECVREGPLEMRQRQLDSLNVMFHLDDEELNNETSLKLTKCWFEWLQSGLSTLNDPTAYFFDQLKRPLKELRRPIGTLFKNLIRMPWAHQKLATLTGFAEYLSSPLNEKEADMNMMRHEIVGKILETENLLGKFSPMDQERMKKFFNNGPYYKGVARVIVETEQA